MCVKTPVKKDFSIRHEDEMMDVENKCSKTDTEGTDNGAKVTLLNICSYTHVTTLF